MIPRVAGIKSHENCWNHRKVPLKKGMKINKDRRQEGSKSMLLKAYIAGQSMSWDISNGKRGTPQTAS